MCCDKYEKKNLIIVSALLNFYILFIIKGPDSGNSLKFRPISLKECREDVRDIYFMCAWDDLSQNEPIFRPDIGIFVK